ncbi:MAG: hypothetical protein BV459_00165 [Thermoplasmata archaeon M11B2D]|nr:MAG: hypothetical protein BV459_00165 [Thermoplasmata archaeon M11B2D]PNX54120.1 MAG: hypothetical protein BV458_01070 [Thermoplasmata archaeon M9B2D]
MKQCGKGKKTAAGVVFILLISIVGVTTGAPQEPTPQSRGILEYEPKSHDFGNMSEGEINSTIFDIWTSGGCCELIFDLTWSCPWVTVFPTSGVTNGEHIPITVTIDTTGLDYGFHGCGIQITTNGGGDGIFNVTVMIISHDTPWLAVYPQSYYFGVILPNITKSTEFDIWNSGTGTLSYTLSWSESWVTVSPTNGISTGEHDPINVTIDTTGLVPETTYECYISIESNGGNKLFFLWFTIGTIPEISIQNIKGGLFYIKTVVKNSGNADAIAVDWKITLSGNGLILLGKETSGRISIVPAGEERTISSGVILGLNDVEVTVTLQNDQTLPILEKRTAKLFLFFIKI